jgi:DNA-directed RNA polymerase subunit RPC12/RpoP
MRCPKCSHNHKHKDGMTCSQCGYQFVFNPKTDKLRDNIIHQMIQQLSDNGQYYFTRTQLALEICKYWRKKKTGPILLVSIVLFIWLFIAVSLELDVFTSVVIFCLILPLPILLGIYIKNNTISLKTAEAAIQRYHSVHPIEPLANGKAFSSPPDKPQQTAISKPNIANKIQTVVTQVESQALLKMQTPTPLKKLPFAPERLLIVERDDIVDMLIRNRFHQNTKTVVVSQSGYPASVFKACHQFLKQNPKMPVQVLHEASLQTFGMIDRLRNDPKWQFARENLVELGLSRKSLTEKKYRLPWLSEAKSESLIFSKNHKKMLSEGRKLPVDYLSPKPLLNTLSVALVSGVLLVAALEEAHSGVSIESSDGDDGFG